MAEAWAKVAATRLSVGGKIPSTKTPAGPLQPRVLTIWGTSDWLSARAPAAWIAEVINRVQPGNGTFVALDSIDHFFFRAASPEESYRLFKPAKGAPPGEFNPVILETLRTWLDETAGSASVSRGQDINEPLKELGLSYQDFDQRPGAGWRKIADQGKHLEAAKLIDRYEKEKHGLEEWQRMNLRFHAGQLYAFVDQKDQALTRFKTALFRMEPADSPIRWNAYVQATIAFLERDRKKLTELREEIATGPKLQGVLPNLEVVDRLIDYFDEPYVSPIAEIAEGLAPAAEV